MEQTAVEYLVENSHIIPKNELNKRELIKQAKEIEKTNIDNKAIHFAEWLTKKHTFVLMELYEQFEEQHYNGK